MPNLDVYSIYSGTNNWSFDKSNDLSGFALTLTLILLMFHMLHYSLSELDKSGGGRLM